MINNNKKVMLKQEIPPVIHPEVFTLGILASRLSQPVTIAYNGETLILPPQGRSRPLDKRFLGALPGGVIFVPLKK